MRLEFQASLEDLKVQAYDKVRKTLYNHIVVDSDFPEWKQANYADTYAYLTLKELKHPLTPKEQETLAGIESVRQWKTDLLSNRDAVKEAIASATTPQEVAQAVALMDYKGRPNV